MSSLPTGTVTFLFTDIEGSTKLLQAKGERYYELLEAHATLLRKATADAGGVEVNTEGDAFFVVFPSAPAAVAGAVEAQRALYGYDWPEGAGIRVRMGLHTGDGILGARDYVGLDVHRAARVASAGHGGQVLLSGATASLVRQSLPVGVTLRDLGPHRLKDLTHPEQLHDLVIQDLPSDFPPPKTLDARPNNLPVQLSSFVGREAELAKVRDSLLDGARLLTLTGPGGTGKTRLALQTAADLLTEFADGSFFVDLSALTDVGLVPSSIAEALGVTETAERPAIDALKEHLAQKHLLLVLDNFEQVVDAGPMVQALLSGAPRLTALVTSREVLRVYGEREFPVPPLALPDPARLPDLATLSQFESVALFIERAVAVRPGFAISNENAPAVAEICARLEGLPLAIELCASRVKLLSSQQILDRLGQRLPLLTGGPRDLPERQRTLRGAIEWSYDLLDDDERRLFEHVSVFMGGGTLEAMEYVCSLAGGTDTIGGLGSLVDKSLLRQIEERDGEPRFVMLETIREFGLERLTARGEIEDLRRRHAAYFLALAEEAEPNVMGPEAATWLDRLTDEHDNLRAALRWSVDAPDPETSLRMAGALWRFWHQRAHFAEGRAWFDEMLALPTFGARTEARLKGLTGFAGIAYWQGDYPAAEAAYVEALEIARELGDPLGIARALRNVSYMPALRGDLPESGRLAEEAATLLEEAGATVEALDARGEAGYYPLMVGDPVRARPLLEQAFEGNLASGDAYRMATSHHVMGQLERLSGNLDDAAGHYRDAIRAFRAMGDDASMLEPLEGLASVASMRADHVRALRLGGAARAAREALGGGPPPEWLMPADVVGEARKGIGDEPADREWAEGRAMKLDEAVALALADDERSER